jgi:Ubiquitin-associated protein 2
VSIEIQMAKAPSREQLADSPVSGSRGGRGGRMGPRGGQTSYRDQNHRNNFRNNHQEQQEIDNWDPASTQVNDNSKGDETWGDCGDWDNEEYTGSLSDTKVFTPSGATQSTGQELSVPPGLETQILKPPAQGDVQYSTKVVSSTATAGALNNGQYGSEMHSGTTAAAQLRQALEMPLGGQSASLSAEQSQYFNTLGSQNNTAYSSTVQYPYNDQVGSQQTPRQQQQRPRARVPPPSKIPSSAVEMPGDGLNVYNLGVQFGELDFGTGTEESYETDKYAPGMDQSAGDDYSSKGTGVSKGSQSTGLGGLQPISDSISSTAQSDLSSGYAQRNPNAAMGTAGGQSALDQLTKPGADIYNSGTTTGANAYQNLSYSGAQKSGGYQTGYGTNAYNNSTQSNNYQQPSNSYGYNQNSYQQSQGTQSGTGQQQTQTTGSSGTANQPVNNSSG